LSFVIGVTGGIGSGKSTVTDHFSRLGILIADSDVIAREVVAPGSEALNEISARFGNKVLNADGSLDRKQLRQIIFDRPEERQWLESVTHPRIRARRKELLTSAPPPYSILSSPLLIESGLQTEIQRLCIVDLPEDIQLQRASNRDGATAESISKIIAAQISRRERLKLADDIIDNSGTIEETLSQVETLHQQYIQLAESL